MHLETVWRVREHPGYLGGQRTEVMNRWNQRFGIGNWRLEHWQTAQDKLLSFDEVFGLYVLGYELYFRSNRDEAEKLRQQHSFGFDRDAITREQAFDSHALYNIPGRRNQFHHVAFNIAVVSIAGPFLGAEPIQVREGKKGTPQESWPAGWRWSPRRIPCHDPSIIPKVKLCGEQWWQDGTIEDFYQKAKVLEIQRRVLRFR